MPYKEEMWLWSAILSILGIMSGSLILCFIGAVLWVCCGGMFGPWEEAKENGND